jgi:Glycosyltransferase WbsX
MNKIPKLIAFHLPQFYPTPYNDEWWGKGFTEWTNVTKARPRFKGHYQPHLPADLGFYDLRLPESRDAQAELASAYGIHGFCYYHYWFKGKRVLELPVNEILRLGKPNFRFCFSWANHNWTRGWDGGNQKVLIEQLYSAEDDIQHIRWLCEAFSDPRYIRVDGKPLFLVYHSSRIPDRKATTDRWRGEAQRLGVGELHLCLMENNFDYPLINPTEYGFDAAVEFQPKLWLLPDPLFERALVRFHLDDGSYRLHSYSKLVNGSLAEAPATYLRYPCVCPGWDNTSRKTRRGLVLKDSTPELYELWLRGVIARTAPSSGGDKIIFVNAWNEWAEGCHLEPCQKWGRQYLEATLRAVRSGNLI